MPVASHVKSIEALSVIVAQHTRVPVVAHFRSIAVVASHARVRQATHFSTDARPRLPAMVAQHSRVPVATHVKSILASAHLARTHVQHVQTQVQQVLPVGRGTQAAMHAIVKTPPFHIMIGIRFSGLKKCHLGFSSSAGSTPL